MKKPNASKAISLFLAMWLLCTSAFFPAAQAETSSAAQPDPGETYVEPMLLVLTTNIEDSGVVWKFNFYSGMTLEKAVFANVKSSITSGEPYITTGYMYSTRIGHNGPVSFSVVNTDGTTTDKATVTSGGTFKALKPGQVKLRITYPGAPYYWVQYVTIKSAGCRPYLAIDSASDYYDDMNCHGYAFLSTEELYTNYWYADIEEDLAECENSNDFLYLVKGKLENNWLDKHIGEGYWEDVTNSGGINAELEDNQWLVVMRAGYHEDNLLTIADYHFWYRTNTGEWANKHGYGSCSEQLGDDLPTTTGSDGWKLTGAIYINGAWCSLEYDNYYDSDLVYYRITEGGTA